MLTRKSCGLSDTLMMVDGADKEELLSTTGGGAKGFLSDGGSTNGLLPLTGIKEFLAVVVVVVIIGFFATEDIDDTEV